MARGTRAPDDKVPLSSVRSEYRSCSDGFQGSAQGAVWAVKRHLRPLIQLRIGVMSVSQRLFSHNTTIFQAGVDPLRTYQTHLWPLRATHSRAEIGGQENA